VRIPVLTDLLDVLLPRLCVGCGEINHDDTFLCGACAEGLKQCRLSPGAIPLNGLPVIAPFEYEFPVSAIISTAKFRSMPHLFRPLALAMYEALVEANLDGYPQVVVSVPLHPSRRRERGFDQALYLARLVAGYLDRSFCPRALKRVRATPPQKRSNRQQRLAALHEAFGPGPQAARVEGRRVLLVDDVVTTGATLEAAVQALLPQLPAGIVSLVAARTPPPDTCAAAAGSPGADVSSADVSAADASTAGPPGGGPDNRCIADKRQS